jgi:hypothetical protein
MKSVGRLWHYYACVIWTIYIYIYMQILNSLCWKLSEQIQIQRKLNKHMYGYTYQRTGAQCYLAGPVPLFENQPYTSFHKTIIYHSSTSIYCKLMNRWLCTISNPHMFTKNKSRITTHSQKSSVTNCNTILGTLAFNDISHKFCVISSFLHTTYMIYKP